MIICKYGMECVLLHHQNFVFYYSTNKNEYHNILRNMLKDVPNASRLYLKRPPSNSVFEDAKTYHIYLYGDFLKIYIVLCSSHTLKTL